jgi:LacI family transcriptional regulator
MPTPVITCRDVARVAQVSPGTVSRVLSKKPNVNLEIQRRVLKAVEATGYIYTPRKRGSVESAASEPEVKRTFIFCVSDDVVPGSPDAYFYQVLRGAEAECGLHNCNLQYLTLSNNPQAMSRTKADIQSGNIAGLILVNPNSRELIKGLAQLQLPLVLVDPYFDEDEIDLVSSDARKGAVLAVNHLVKLGHRNIALINGPISYSMARRKDGYRAALEEADLPYIPELNVRNSLTVSGGETAVNTILERGKPFSAIFCANDNLAFGAIRALNAAGLRVPEDVSIVGFNDVDTAALLPPALTTVNANLEGKGMVAVQRLLSRINYPGQAVFQSILPVRLIERSSTTVFNG